MHLRIFFVIFLVITAGCTGKKESQESTDVSDSKVINLFIWSSYVSPWALEEFEKKTGFHVQQTYFSSNEELLAKLQGGAVGYDIILPSDYMTSVMIKLGMLMPLDKKLIPNKENVSAEFLGKSYDPENNFSMPYAWTTTGIAVRTDLLQAPITSWKDFLANPQLHGKFSLLDDAREALGAALKLNGLSLNSTKKEDLDKAKSTLMRARKAVRTFNSEPLSALVNGEVVAAHAYSSDALQSREKMPGKINFVLPKEGATMAIDNLAIPKGAPHPKEAHNLINFLLQARASADLSQTRFVGSVIKGVREHLPKEIAEDPIVFPPKAVMDTLEMIVDLGEATRPFDRLWTEIKASE